MASRTFLGPYRTVAWLLVWTSFVATSFFATSMASAAMVAKLNLATDGSSTPPGDRLDVTVVFFPGDESVRLETQAYVQPVEGGEVKAVRSRDPQLANARGELTVTTTVPKPRDSRTVAVSVVIPYRALSLTPGMYRLGYQITAWRGDQVDFIKATEMAVVVVDQRTRTSMRVSRETARPVRERHIRSAQVIRNGEVTRQNVEIETTRYDYDFQDRSARVQIPGSFSRPLLAMAMPPEPFDSPEDQAKSEALPYPGQPWESAAKFVPEAKRTVFYATNRAVDLSKGLTVSRFGKQAAELTFGTCLVNIPIESHVKGKLELPGWWSSRDPKKHFLVESLSVLDREAFRERTAENDILLFVHGYNTSFEYAVLRTSQLVHDLEFPGQGLTFSWPSAANVQGYFHDEEQAQASVVALVELFRILSGSSGSTNGKPRKIHVIAHSMGNRVFLQAVRQFELEEGKESARRVFGQVALAAPDVNGALFGALIPSLVRQASHVTLYYCETDRALEASRTIHQDKPVGLGPCFAEGVDTINAEAVNTEVLGHGYFASAHELLIDLRLLIIYSLLPDERLPPLGNRTVVLGFPHWSFLMAP